MTTIIELLPEFIEHLTDERQLQPATIASYTIDLRQVHDSSGGKEFDRLELSDIREFMRELKNDGKTASTIRRKLHALSTFYEFQIINERCQRNLSRHAQRIAPRRKQTVQRKLLTVEQWRTFSVTPGATKRDTLAWKLLAWWGVRQSELRSIRVGDVSLESKYVIIRGKGGHERRLPLPHNSEIVGLIKELMMGCEPGDYLLSGVVSDKWAKNAFYDAFNEHRSRCGLPDEVTPHWLRHTVATYLSQKMSVFELRTWMGHKSTRTTELYVHNSPDMMQKAADLHPLR